jgi:hypothetical protein
MIVSTPEYAVFVRSPRGIAQASVQTVAATYRPASRPGVHVRLLMISMGFGSRAAEDGARRRRRLLGAGLPMIGAGLPPPTIPTTKSLTSGDALMTKESSERAGQCHARGTVDGMEDMPGSWRRFVGKAAVGRRIRRRRGGRRDAPMVGSRRGGRCRREGDGRSLRTRRAGARDIAAGDGWFSGVGLEQSQVYKQARMRSVGVRLHIMAAARTDRRRRAANATQEQEDGSGHRPRHSSEEERFHCGSRRCVGRSECAMILVSHTASCKWGEISPNRRD